MRSPLSRSACISSTVTRALSGSSAARRRIHCTSCVTSRRSRAAAARRVKRGNERAFERLTLVFHPILEFRNGREPEAIEEGALVASRRTFQFAASHQVLEVDDVAAHLVGVELDLARPEEELSCTSVAL